MSSVEKEEGVLAIQITLIFAQIALIMGAGYVTLIHAGAAGNQNILDHIRAFSGGVFLGMAILHMLPEAVEDVQSEFPEYHEMAFTMLIVGYLMILAIEKVVMDAHGAMHAHGEHGHGHGDHSDHPVSRHSALGESLPAPADSTDVFGAHTDDDHGHGHALLENDQFQESVESPEDKENQLVACVLILALSFHAIIEGVAIGLQTQFQSMLTLAIGVLLHMWAEGVAIAAALVTAKRSRKASLIFLFFFSIASPTGIIIGLIVSSAASALLNGILMSIAAGTFVYVACNEIIGEEFEKAEARKTKFLALVMGIVIIGMIGVLFPHDHDHHDHDDGNATSHDHAH